jgi:hypothetical protein
VTANSSLTDGLFGAGRNAERGLAWQGNARLISEPREAVESQSPSEPCSFTSLLYKPIIRNVGAQ